MFGQKIGIQEMLLSQAFSGVLHVVAGGSIYGVQRTTGPIVVYIIIIFEWSTALDIEFLPFLSVCGLWLGGKR